MQEVSLKTHATIPSMIYEATYGKTTWVDVEQPTRDDITILMKNYAVSTEIAKLLLDETRRSYFRVIDDSMYLVLHFPTIQDRLKTQSNSEQEIDFIIQKNKIITVRYSGVSALDAFKKQIEMEEMIEEQSLEQTPSNHQPLELFHSLLEFQYEKSNLFAEEIADSIDRIENRMFEGEENRMVNVISVVNRRVLEHTRCLTFHQHILNDVLLYLQKYQSDEHAKLIRRTIRHYTELMNILQSHKEILQDLRDTNDILVNTKTNNIMKILTLLTFVMIPITIGLELVRDEISSVLGSDFTVPVVVIVASLFTIAFFALFKYKKWL